MKEIKATRALEMPQDKLFDHLDKMISLSDFAPDVEFPVNLRELHEVMGIGKHFATWVIYRTQKLRFVEGKDFIVRYPELGTKGRGGKNRKDFFASIEMAQQLAMMEKNEVGDKVRWWFIDRNRQYKEMVLAEKRPKVQHETVIHGVSPFDWQTLMIDIKSIDQRLACIEDSLYPPDRLTYGGRDADDSDTRRLMCSCVC